MLVKVELCPACAEVLRAVLKEQGEEALGRAVGPIISKCATCRVQLPGQGDGGRLKTKMKRPS